jgi:transposase InsO family protein
MLCVMPLAVSSARWLSEAYWLPLSLCQSKSFAGFLWLSAIDNASEIFEYIEVFYNRKRRHSANDYKSPADYEMSLKAA